MRAALAVPTAAALIVALAPPAAAAPPTVTTVDSASAMLSTDTAAVFVDGFDGADVNVGAVEVFAGALECFQPEPQGFSFVADGTASAALEGTARLDCYDTAQDRALTAEVTADLGWTAAGAPTTTRSHSRQLGCTSVRHTAPAAVTGTVRVVVAAAGLDLTLTGTPETPAELARQTDRCATPGR